MTWKESLFVWLFGLIVGLIIANQISCGPSVTLPHKGSLLSAPTATVSETTETDTVFVDRIVFRDRWRVRETPARVEVDTLRESLPSPAYIARLDTVTPYRDTVRVAYRHPERTFTLDLSPRPDTVRTLFMTETKTIVLRENRKWGIGFHAGPGLQIARDGITRAGIEVGVGINFNLWEP